jgi:hypothetical protein
MRISFEIPPDIEELLRPDLGGLEVKARDAFLLELYREGRISHAVLRESLGLGFDEIERLIKERGMGQDLSLDEYEEGRAALRASRP